MDQSKPSKNEVKDIPEGWYRWAANNADRIKAAAAQGKEPWFIRDNKAVWDETLAGLKYPENFEAYRRLKADENYTEVAFD